MRPYRSPPPGVKINLSRGRPFRALPWPCNLSLPLRLTTVIPVASARLSKNPGPPRAGAPRLRGAPAGGRIQDRRTAPRLGLTGLEPVTPRLSSACSKPAELQAPRPNWRQPGSNRRPPACKAGALPLSYAPSCSGADRPLRRVFPKGCAARALPRVSLGRAPRGDPAWGPRGHRPVGGGRRAGAPAFSLERR